jgi:spermidine synthase
MNPWTLLESASIPGNGGELRLYQRCEEFSITLVGRGELMSSRVHGSEEALGELACARVADRAQPRVLIGGLGMGFTLAAALKALGPTAEVVVAELVLEVVQWNRGLLGEPAGHPLRDARATVRVGDVGCILRKERRAFDALRPQGVLGVWSAGPDAGFSDRLRRMGCAVEEVVVRGRGPGKGARHTIWLAG